MTVKPTHNNLALLLEDLEIPASAYERAHRRYRSLGEFFSSEHAKSAGFSPHIYAQGSFRLGTVVRPLGGGEYDIDIGCRLRSGITKDNITQRQLKDLVGSDIETYRRREGISQHREEKRRCWRLAYQDDLAFHMDVVPSIPEDVGRRRILQESIQRFGVDAEVAARVALHAGAITDNETANYDRIDRDWKISNSEGFALWFESRMRLASELLETFAARASTTVDRLPHPDWQSPLQDAVRVLKRHRDAMFRDQPDSQPISVIITTLSAQAYRGESDLESALAGILSRMGSFVRDVAPRVPNPVNPEEDFADKWGEAQYANLHLEYNFQYWLGHARADFANLLRAGSQGELKMVLERFGSSPSEDRLARALGGSVVARPPTLVEPATKPWSDR